MKNPRLVFARSGAILSVLALVACAPRSGGPTEGAEGTGGAAAGQEVQATGGAAVAYAPEAVHVTITKTADGCDIDVSQPQVVLHKNPTKGANKAVWTWSGPDYEKVWVSVPANDLRTCFDLDTLKGDSARKGFQIVMPDGTRKTVDPAGDCKIGTYQYEIGAKGKSGVPDCGADPTVKIED